MLHQLFERGGFILLQRVQVVQLPQEEQVCDLLDDLEWVGDPPDQKASQMRSI